MSEPKHDHWPPLAWALRVRASKHSCLKLVTCFFTAIYWFPYKMKNSAVTHLVFPSPSTMLHPVTFSSWILSIQDTGLYYSEQAWQILMTWITQVQRNMTAVMKLSSLHFCLFIFHWEVSLGRTLSVLTLCVFSKHLSTVYLQNVILFSVNLTAVMMGTFYEVVALGFNVSSGCK